MCCDQIAPPWKHALTRLLIQDVGGRLGRPIGMRIDLLCSLAAGLANATDVRVANHKMGDR
ncbi:hypothetical protein C8Q78DRAFT_1005664 [Trametes maxima]|nr:hypothetical protein C8Q78DRAFT_1005664 [Trametes maxima]